MYKPKQSVKQLIYWYIKNNGNWVSGMELESKAYEWGSKRIGRTLRDMSSGDYPILEKSYTNDKFHAVQYRLRQSYKPKPELSVSEANEFLEGLKREQRMLF